MNALLIFIFCLMRRRIKSGMLVFDLIVFFWKMVMDAHDSVSDNKGCVIDDVDGIMVF